MTFTEALKELGVRITCGDRWAADNARLRTENDVLRRDYGIKRRQYDEAQAALEALQDALR